jgi:hypothetical protein
VADSSGGPVVPVLFDEHAIADDLHHLPGGARVALDAFRRELDRDGGLSMTRLKRCDAEGRDGTNLGGCLKTYVPWPTGRFGLVFVPRSLIRRVRSPYVRSRSVSAIPLVAARVSTGLRMSADLARLHPCRRAASSPPLSRVTSFRVDLHSALAFTRARGRGGP